VYSCDRQRALARSGLSIISLTIRFARRGGKAITVFRIMQGGLLIVKLSLHGKISM